MSVYIDRKFLHLVSPKLLRFSQKKPDLYNFRCPICGDSKKNKTKSRGYVYRKNNDYFYTCHNCGVSHTFYNFLNAVDSSLIKEYALERYKNGEQNNHNYPKPTFDEFKQIPKFKTRINLPTIESLDDNHIAKKYVIDRKIPEKHFKELYYSEDFKFFIENVLKVDSNKLIDDDQRLIIPFYDANNNLFGLQGRSLTGSKIRYITIILDKNAPKIFGMNNLDVNKKVYVMEGPIDSLFITNAIATADSDLIRCEKLNLNDVTLVFDNEPRNKEIVKQIEKAIKKNFKICLFPDHIQQKDINDMILSGYTEDQIIDIIEENSFSGLRADLEFSKWRKV
jgi:transcription elongation factor Elf1